MADMTNRDTPEDDEWQVIKERHDFILRSRDEGVAWGKIAERTGLSEEDVRREYMMAEFGRRLKRARELRWPIPRQVDWAKEIGLSDVRQYQRWEHGQQLPSLERLPKIREVSGESFDDLFEPEGSMTRDNILEHFDVRILELEQKVEANFFTIIDMVAEMRALLETRLPE